ncbi:arylsulfatase J-like [Liolophura sinensis]|uniref:arylsulfatase J-like n=1 Tax=Liolophura sinensis TaxID=3198878 RepID=UPI00315889AB
MDSRNSVHTTVSLLLLICFSVSGCRGATRPHVIFIVADDLGWNDVSWHNPDIISPHLDGLARDGVILGSSYVQPNCSPSRSCFMSGKYPYHTGLQSGVIYPLEPRGMPLSLTTLPEKLKEAGYINHMVGKWHLGFCNQQYLPTSRGFDTFVGFYLGLEDHYTHRRGGYDMRFNDTLYSEAEGIYSTELFGQRAVDIINSHPSDQPLFLYLSFQAVHGPLQVPQRYEDMNSHIKNRRRRRYSAMVTAMDEAVGNVRQALEATGLMENSVIIFNTDNGGPAHKVSNNLPLRGSKNTLYEGGTKGPAFVYSKKHIKKTGYINNQMIHAVDWFPTILHLAGVTPDRDIDGVNQWPTLSEGVISARKEFVYNIDESQAAIRVGKYKLIQGSAGDLNGWYPVVGSGASPTYVTGESIDFRLYDIEADPSEHFDLASQFPSIVKLMKRKLKQYRKSTVPAGNQPHDQRGNPNNFGGAWSPGWC